MIAQAMILVHMAAMWCVFLTNWHLKCAFSYGLLLVALYCSCCGLMPSEIPAFYSTMFWLT